MKLNDAIDRIREIEAELSTHRVMINPHKLSELMFKLGQYTSVVEKELGDIEERYEIVYSEHYSDALNTEKSITAAKQRADLLTAEIKGQIKKLSRYVASSWKVHQSAMARWKHLNEEMKGSV